MIAVFSTSSPLASVALFSESGDVLGAHTEVAGRNAGAVVLRGLNHILASLGKTSSEIQFYVGDVGPGSFTGIRVGVILAKSLAYAHQKLCGALSSFDLISPEATVAIGAKRGSYFVRLPGGLGLPHQEEWPQGALGYAPDQVRADYPLAERAGPLLGMIKAISPFELLPDYVAEPNISLPKRPYGPGQGAARS